MVCSDQVESVRFFVFAIGTPHKGILSHMHIIPDPPPPNLPGKFLALFDSPAHLTLI